LLDNPELAAEIEQKIREKVVANGPAPRSAGSAIAVSASDQMEEEGEE
jgi:hypothetical protein